jgi:hypothetical protein
MSRIEWLVAIAGVALVAWINWYFFLAGKTVGKATPPKDVP